MNHYELMVIFTPVLSEEEYKASAKQLKKIITDAEGEIVGEDFWGLRSFAYPIQKKTTGLYYVLEYKANTDLNSKLIIQMNRNESIMRQMITVLDKHAIAYNNRKRTGEKIAPKNNSVNENQEA
ncbi:MAG: 30S ribosomal protein S6 [Chitinophagaceae bacterium]